jgi:exosortase A
MSNLRKATFDRGLGIYLLILAAAATVVLVYWETFSSIVSMWSLMPYRHGYLIFPAAAYFLWQQRFVLATRPVSGSWVGCALLFWLSVLWIVARATTVQAVEQLVVVLMISALVLAALGPAVFRAAAFPLLLLVAAVPMGETLVPGLMSITADVAELLLRAVGLPAHRQGQVITVPSGSFEVTAICAGLNYLLAGVVTAIVFAQWAYVAWAKRIILVSLAAAGFIVANGVRVFLVIYLHNLTDGQIFAHDHVWFGMVIFGVVMVLMLAVGARFADPVPAPQPGGSNASIGFGRSSVLAAIVGVVAIVIGPAVQARRVGTVAGDLNWPQLPVIAGCDGPQSWSAGWGPFMVGSDVERSGTYQCGDHAVDVFIAVYGSQGEGKELVSSENELIPDFMASRGRRSVASFLSSNSDPVMTTQIGVSGDESHLVWTWYSVGEAAARSGFRVKAYEALNAVRLEMATSALYLVAVRGHADDGAEMRPVVEAVARALWDSSAPGRAGNASE